MPLGLQDRKMNETRFRTQPESDEERRAAQHRYLWTDILVNVNERELRLKSGHDDGNDRVHVFHEEGSDFVYVVITNFRMAYVALVEYDISAAVEGSISPVRETYVDSEEDIHLVTPYGIEGLPEDFLCGLMPHLSECEE